MRKKRYNLIFPLLVMGLFLVFASSCKKDDVKDDVPVIGSSYGGGLVFYIDGAGHGLICALIDQGYTEWGCSGTAIGGTSTAINTGAANTNAIVAGCGEPYIAAKVCNEYDGGGYTDWFLPSKDELNLMYTNLHKQGLGNFEDTLYWSSSERIYTTNTAAWIQVFDDFGLQYLTDKVNMGRVRAVRAF